MTSSDTKPSGAAVETKSATGTTVSCDGGGALGHPRIYLEIGEGGHVDCPYCGCRFALGEGGEARS